MLNPEPYDHELISQFVLAYKGEHDGIPATIRQVIDFYEGVMGRRASTSHMRTLLQHICRERDWKYTERGIETNGEWYKDRDS